MKKVNLLSKAEMKKIVGGITPEMANCEEAAWLPIVIDQDGNCRFTGYNFCLRWCSPELCDFGGKCTLTAV
ncbi:hypothetical protein [Pedobacter sp. Hv1]|uniref:hypothetical protein n=1 Tax=Pedobacter sp. Hv1 TaxID=1740090 RepID=UPI0006D8AF18|nr:hypothetical protein [Pedobacter sp. Hv1]KQC00598.1 hypothetical protein AQF98_07880 [Pedobacter sp. Hv1]